MHSGSAFASTQWSLVLAAPDDPAILDSLLRCYLGPIYAYIRRAGNARDRAADLTQDFVSQVILERGLLDRADPARGRFRTFLKSALANFLVDQHRRSTTRARAPAEPLLGGLKLDDIEPSDGDDPEAAFDRQWATSVLSATLDRVEADCNDCGQAAHWAAFSASVIEPVVRHTSLPGMEDLARRLGVPQSDQVSSMIQTVRRKFRRTLLQVVQETMADPSQAPDELTNLRNFLRI
jgi:DNA-directed RNA polymerase specialized sigma24 family protein